MEDRKIPSSCLDYPFDALYAAYSGDSSWHGGLIPGRQPDGYAYFPFFKLFMPAVLLHGYFAQYYQL